MSPTHVGGISPLQFGCLILLTELSSKSLTFPLNRMDIVVSGNSIPSLAGGSP